MGHKLYGVANGISFWNSHLLIDNPIKKNPTYLKCGHSFCRKCAIKYKKTWIEGNDGTEDFPRCPTCRILAQGSHSSMISTKDKTLANLLEELDFECYHKDCQVFKLVFSEICLEGKKINKC